MIITDDAKRLLEELFVEHQADCLVAQLANSCCGSNMMFSLAQTTPEDTDPLIVNGIKIFFDDEASKNYVQYITLEAHDGRVEVADSNHHDCGCGCGCHHH